MFNMLSNMILSKSDKSVSYYHGTRYPQTSEHSDTGQSVQRVGSETRKPAFFLVG